MNRVILALLFLMLVIIKECCKLKKVILLLLMLIITSAVFAIDWGGNIANYTLIENEIDELTQKNKLSLWLELNPTNLIKVEGEASVAYSYDDYNFLLNLDSLYTDIIIPKDLMVMTIKLGRFFQSEFSGNVFAHTMDGLFFSIGIPIGNFSFGIGYTGLLMNAEANLNQTNADFADDNSNSILAPKKLIANLSASFIDIFPSHQLNIAVVGQYDLRSGTILKEGDLNNADGNIRFNTIYAGIGFSGVAASFFVYDLFFYYQLGNSLVKGNTAYENNLYSAFIGGTNIYYLLDKYLYSKFSLSFLYASGDNGAESITADGNANGDNTQFIPVTEVSTGLLFDPNVSNLMKASFAYSLKPFSGSSNRIMKEFLASVSGTAYFKATEGAVSESTEWLAEGEKYLGTEAILRIGFRPVSDFGLALAGAVFIPNSSSIDNDIQYGGMVHASLSF